MTVRTKTQLNTLYADNAAGDISAEDLRDLVDTAIRDTPTAAGASAFGDAASGGTSEELAKVDHKHSREANPVTAHEAAGDPHAAYALDTDLTTHAAAVDPHTGYLLESLIDAIGDLIVGASDNTPAKLAKPATSEQSVTTPSSFSTANWGSQTANARKTLVVDPSTGQLTWDFIYATDINTPTQVTAFTATPAGGTSGSGLVASTGTDIPAFAMTYQGTPTAVTIDIVSHTYGGGRNPEVVGSDYPATVITPFASLSGPAINRGQAVAETVTFRVTATIAGASRTKDVTVTYVNYRYYGVSTEAAIDTDAEIDTFATTQTNSLVNSRSASFTVTAGANEYIYFIIRNALGTPTFTVGGFEGGFSLVGNDVTHTNSRSFSELFDVWRSDNHSLGSTTVTVT